MNSSSSVPALAASHVTVRVPGAERALVSDVDITAYAGRTLVIVGESGAGKSMLARTICGLTPVGLEHSGIVTIHGETIDLADPVEKLRSLRGSGIVWLPQDPFTSLSPTQRAGDQMLAHRIRRRVDKEKRIRERLTEVGLDERVRRAFPHELSGGMRQRVAIGAALDAEPSVLIADEPTTALDVTTQRDILTLLTDLRSKRHMALVLITHDLALAREFGDDIVVMRAGEVVESGHVGLVLVHPRAEYTKALAQAEPRIDGPDPRAHSCGDVRESPLPDTEKSSDIHEDEGGVTTANPPRPPIAVVENLVKIFRSARSRDAHVALDGVSLDIQAGESVGIVGESGSGKTTLARCLIGLETPDGGSLRIQPSRSLLSDSSSKASGRGRRRTAGPVGIVFQNPYSALNPALRIEQSLTEALGAAGRDGARAGDLLEQVDLPVDYLKRFPSELSGGERQRIAIARAIATQPELLICDEAVSALDVSVQAQILRLLCRLQQIEGFALLFITHDLAVARQMSDRLIVMKDGYIVEEGKTAQLLSSPRVEYTQRLLAAVPGVDTSPLSSSGDHR
ncbi:ABC transporter ATP-binding protein [Schaalia sp. ZJ405]|uniref:ATP-binding cassette domain-containing protein n=1 Tax=Schaalia sp. ZJ405 TaxID=2709403 RepID=UPI0013EC199B|nr:ABC transporter ATP-binding protein [Schaalia sp. ZJ405]QPK80649.1 ABC transporter ATP-binding protein [Schaalia sp. ZJ405]